MEYLPLLFKYKAFTNRTQSNLFLGVAYKKYPALEIYILGESYMLLIQRFKIFNERITTHNELYSMSGVLTGASYPILIRTSKQFAILFSANQ